MTANKIPSVLYQAHGNSLSIERVIKQTLDLLSLVPDSDDATEARLIVTIEDLETILSCLDRS